MQRRGFAVQRVFWLGCGMVVLLLAGGYGYFRWANSVPEFHPPAVRLPDPNGFDALVAAAELIRPLPSATSRALREGNFDPDGSMAEQWRMVAANRAAFAAARAALKLEYREPPQYSFDARYPHYAKFRNLARGLAGASRVALADGRADEAAEYALDVMEMGSRIPRGAPLIGGLVGIACHSIGFAALEPTLLLLSPKATTTVAARVNSLVASWPTFGDSLEAERHMMLGGLTAHFREASRLTPWGSLGFFHQNLTNGHGSRVTPEALSLAIVPKQAALASLDRYYRELIAESRKPFARRQEPQIPEDPVGRAAQVAVTAFKKTELLFDESGATLAALETWLAARHHQQEHGTPSRNAAALKRGLPLDPFSGQPCVYRVIADGFVVYSIGADGTDDGGKPIHLRKRKEDERGDLVIGQLYPPKPDSSAGASRGVPSSGS